MDPSTVLDAVLFQLTPTRTRFELVIKCKGEQEKLASGLLQPFIVHLKVAEEAIAKGGYGFVLDIPSSKDRSWFTKSTVERFVRFVSTPEILERVNNIESEIAQIEDSITNLFKNGLEASKVVGNLSYTREFNLSEGKRDSVDSSNPQGENSRTKLARTLENRIKSLEKEQGMAYARAAAAGFDTNYMDDLVLFANYFGAYRFKDACLRIKDLIKRKQAAGMWSEMDMCDPSSQSDLALPGSSGIILVNNTPFSYSNSANGHNEAGNPSELNVNISSEYSNSIANSKKEEQSNGLAKGSNNGTKYVQQSTTPEWPQYMQNYPPHMFVPGHPMQGFPGHPQNMQPYYPNYPGNSYWPQNMNDPRYGPPKRSDSGGFQKMPQAHTQYSGAETNDESFDEDDEVGPVYHRNSKRRTRSTRTRNKSKKSGMVVIRNINYITSKDKDEKIAADESEYETDTDVLDSSKEKIGDISNGNEVKLYKEGAPAEDNSGWLIFQNSILKEDNLSDSERKQDISRGKSISPLEAEVNMVGRNQVIAGDNGLDSMRNEMHIRKGPMVDDSIFLSQERSEDRQYGNGTRWDQEIDFEHSVIQKNGKVNAGASDMQLEDDSVVILTRSPAHDRGNAEWKTDLNMDSEIPINNGEKKTLSSNFEPQDLMMLPEREHEREPSTFTWTPGFQDDPEMIQEFASKTDSDANGSVDQTVSSDKNGSDKGVGNKMAAREEKSRLSKESATKKKHDFISANRRLTKTSQSVAAKERDQKLRKMKEGLHKTKLEREEEEKRRKEQLEIERQKRIAEKSAASANKGTPKLTTSRRHQIKPLTNVLSLGFQKKTSINQPSSAASSPKPVKKMSKEAIERLSSTKQKAMKEAQNQVTKEVPKQSVGSNEEPKKENLNVPKVTGLNSTSRATTALQNGLVKSALSKSQRDRTSITTTNNASTVFSRTINKAPARKSISGDPRAKKPIIREDKRRASVSMVSKTDAKPRKSPEPSETKSENSEATVTKTESLSESVESKEDSGVQCMEKTDICSMKKDDPGSLSFSLKGYAQDMVSSPGGSSMAPDSPGPITFEFSRLKAAPEPEVDLSSEETFTPRFDFKGPLSSASEPSPTTALKPKSLFGPEKTIPIPVKEPMSKQNSIQAPYVPEASVPGESKQTAVYGPVKESISKQNPIHAPLMVSNQTSAPAETKQTAVSGPVKEPVSKQKPMYAPAMDSKQTSAPMEYKQTTVPGPVKEPKEKVMPVPQPKQTLRAVVSEPEPKHESASTPAADVIRPESPPRSRKRWGSAEGTAKGLRKLLGFGKKSSAAS